MSRTSKTTLNYKNIVTTEASMGSPSLLEGISLDGTIGLLQDDDGSTIAVIGARDLGEIYYKNQSVFANVDETIEALEQILQNEIGDSSVTINVINQDV